jgi:hypothetical protein
MTDRLAGRLVSPSARASARQRANTHDGTRQETSRNHPALGAEQRAKIRMAGAEDARRSRIEQGLPERIEDPRAIVILAALLRTARGPPETRSASRERTQTERAAEDIPPPLSLVSTCQKRQSNSVRSRTNCSLRS